MRIIQFIWGKEMRKIIGGRKDRKGKRELREMGKDLMVGWRSRLLLDLIRRIALFKRKL